MKSGWSVIRILPIFGMLLFLVNCGSSGQQSATPDELSSVQRSIKSQDARLAEYSEQSDSLQNKVEMLRQTIGELEHSNQELRDMLADREGQKFDLNSEQAVADKIIQLENRLTMLEDRIDFIDSTKFDMLTRFEKLESQMGKTPMTTSAPAEQSARTRGAMGEKLSKEEYRAAYQKAYDMYSNKNYQKAIELFTRLIESNPDGDLSDNAQYWIGECYYGLKNYTRAIVEFEKVFTFKESNKDDDAQLKLGLCYLNLGQRDKAREEFQRLVDFYPESNYKSRAVEYLRQL